ncbi:MAG: SCO family protein [Methylococcaceae bacterium]|nr:SCO family protein [Methylococcaceae bacterium]
MNTRKGIMGAILMLSSLSAMASVDWAITSTQYNETVVDQFGKTLRFFDDLINNKIVVINFIFTDCASSCPLSTAIFRQVQKQLGKQPVQLITISVDPDNDTPERLLAFSNKFGAGPGWVFVTGDHAAISGLLKNFGVYSADRNKHSNMVIVGNDTKHQWTRLYGLPQADDIISALNKIAGAKRNY